MFKHAGEKICDYFGMAVQKARRAPPDGGAKAKENRESRHNPSSTRAISAKRRGVAPARRPSADRRIRDISSAGRSMKRDRQVAKKWLSCANITK
jgi:hypothetical protein